MISRKDPERDPLFRGLMVAVAVAAVVALIFDGFGHRNTSSAATGGSSGASSSATSASTATGGTGGSTGDSMGGSMRTMSAQQMAAGHEASMKAYPAKTQGQGDQVLAPTVQNGVKVFRLMAMQTKWEVSPGQFATAFTYNEQVPGPQIRVHQGDTIRVILTNHLPQPTTIHWHGLTVPNKEDGVPYITQDPVMPDKTFTYQFKVVDPPGTYLYHSHFNSSEQVGNGLYGAFVIEPKQTTWDVEYTEILNDGALGYSIDGKGWPATAPLVAKLGQTVLIRLANLGQLLHPIHLHGYHFTVIAQDGAVLARPYQGDTVVVAPGETYDLLVHATQPGVWAMHCHILSHVEGPQGMFGMATALVVQ